MEHPFLCPEMCDPVYYLPEIRIKAKIPRNNFMKNYTKKGIDKRPDQ